MQAPNAREIALRIISQVLDEGAYANIAVHRCFQEEDLSGLDRKFVYGLVYGTVKRWNTLDWLLSKFVSIPMENVEPQVLNILRLGAYQLLFLGKVPASAACNECVKLAKEHGHQGTANFVNGVLRSLARRYKSISDVDFPDIDAHPVSCLSLKYSFPTWMVKRWVARFGVEGTVGICSFHNQPPPHAVRVNLHRTPKKQFENLLTQKGIGFNQSPLCSESLVLDDFALLEGDKDLQEKYIPQSSASTLVGRLLNPKPGEAVLDACAAPGIKTTHLACLMHDEGEVVAADIHPHRVQLIERNAARLGFSCIHTRVMDARKAQTTFGAYFDAALVDAPCSGTGALNRRADARWRKSAAMIEEMHDLQVDILESILPVVKSGGRIIYSTCSLEEEENAAVVDEVLRTHPELKPGEFSQLPPLLQSRENAARIQILPHQFNTDGFFIACFIK